MFGLEMDQIAKIKVIGVGGGGNNAVNRMIESGVKGVEFIVANTDLQVLNASKASNKLQIGKTITNGLGAGANPEVGREAAIESKDEIKEALKHEENVLGTVISGAGPSIVIFSQKNNIEKIYQTVKEVWDNMNVHCDIRTLTVEKCGASKVE